MKEQEFDKLLNESMETPRDLPFDESAWAALETQLDGEQKERKFLFAWWWILPALLGFGLIGWNVLLNNQLNHSQTAINDLKSKITQLEQQAANNNTTQKERIIYKTDTVYRTVSSKTQLSENDSKIHSSKPLTPVTNPISNNYNQAKPLLTSFKNQANQANQNSLLFPKSLFQTPIETKPTIPTIPTKENTTTLDLLPPFALVPFANEQLLDSLNPESYAIESSDEKTKFALRPIKLSIGAASGGFAQVEVDQSQLTGTQQGLQGKVDFGTNLSLVTAAEWINVHYTSSSISTLNDLDDAYRNDANNVFVTANAVFDTVNLIKVTSNEKFLQIPLGVQYAFRKTKQFRPNIGGGVVFVKPFENNRNLNLEFAARGISSPPIGMPAAESTFNYSVADKRTTIPSNAWYFNLGFDHTINHHWSIGLQGRALFESNKIIRNVPQNQVSNFDSSIPNLRFYGNSNPNIILGIYGSLFYKF